MALITDPDLAAVTPTKRDMARETTPVQAHPGTGTQHVRAYI
ncbi:hypothetical protein [Novosphingobium sp.]|nr:hypothetical protein [Novosphingobium sp.]